MAGTRPEFDIRVLSSAADFRREVVESPAPFNGLLPALTLGGSRGWRG